MFSAVLVSTALGLFALPVTEELPAEPIEESVPYLGSAELESAMLEIWADDTCPEWVATALLAGWQPAELPRLMRIMHRESRCKPEACGETDSPHIRKCRDWGLMQINDYSWKSTIRKLGWTMDQMHDPLENLRFARWLFEYSVNVNDDGWHPWRLQKQ